MSGDVTAIVSDHGAVGAHISVSARGRYPTWDELASIKELAFLDVPMGMALPPVGDHVNIAETCLHLWEMPRRIGSDTTVTTACGDKTQRARVKGATRCPRGPRAASAT